MMAKCWNFLRNYSYFHSFCYTEQSFFIMEHYGQHGVSNHRYHPHYPDLVGYIASMKKMTMPEFYTEYKIQDRAGELMCASGHSKVYATIHWDNGASRNVYVIVYKQNGEIYKTIEADRIIDSRGSTVQVEFDSNRDPDGTYAVRAHDENGRVLDQKVVMVGTRECDMPKM